MSWSCSKFCTLVTERNGTCESGNSAEIVSVVAKILTTFPYHSHFSTVFLIRQRSGRLLSHLCLTSPSMDQLIFDPASRSPLPMFRKYSNLHTQEFSDDFHKRFVSAFHRDSDSVHLKLCVTARYVKLIDWLGWSSDDFSIFKMYRSVLLLFLNGKWAWNTALN